MEVSPNKISTSNGFKIRSSAKLSKAKARLNYIRMQIITYLSEISRFRSNSWVLARKAAELLSGTLSTLASLEKCLAILKEQVIAVTGQINEAQNFQNLAILEQNLARIKQAYSIYHEKQITGAKAGIFVVPALAPLIGLGVVKIAAGAAIGSWIFPSLSLGAHAGIAGINEGTKFQRVELPKEIKKTQIQKIILMGKHIINNDPRADWGRFVLAVERYLKGGNDFYGLKVSALDFHKKAVGVIVKRQSSPTKRLAVAMHYFYKQMLFNYQGKKTNPGRFFIGEGGNCVANTRLVFSFIQHFKQRGLIPNNTVPIIFEYTNHWAPGVFYKGEYYDLMEGSKFKKPPTRILKARFFAHHYLEEKLKIKTNIPMEYFIFFDATLVKYPGRIPDQAIMKSPYENTKEFKLKESPAGLVMVNDRNEESKGNKGSEYYLISYERYLWLTRTKEGKAELKALARKGKRIEKALFSWPTKEAGSFFNDYEISIQGIVFRDRAIARPYIIYAVKKIDMAIAKLLLRDRYQPINDSNLIIKPLLPVFRRHTLRTINKATKALAGFINNCTTINLEHLEKILKAAKKISFLYSLNFSPRRDYYSPFIRHFLNNHAIKARKALLALLNNPEKFTNFANKLTMLDPIV